MKSTSFISIKLIIPFFFLLIAPLFTACDGSTDPTDLIFSSSDDVKLGAQLDSSIRVNTKEYPLLNNASAQAYVQNIVNEIIKSPEIDYKDKFVYKVQLINDDKTINAFATPGGYIYVYTGLLKFLDNKATLAAILAHEAAHADRRHAADRIKKQYGVSILLQIALGNSQSQLEEIATNLLTGMYFLKNSRDDEYEADKYSFKYLQSTSYYPGAGIYFFDKIKGNEGSSTLEILLRTHPLSQDRIDALNKLISDAKIGSPSEAELQTQDYSNFKTNILK